MSDDLVALKILVVSDSTSEREALRNAASQASVMIDIAEMERLDDVDTTCRRLVADGIDIVFLDSRMPHDGRQAVIDAARSSTAKPLVCYVGSLDPKSNHVALEGSNIDGLLPKPVDPAEARGLLDACARARLPSRVLVVDDSPTVRSVIKKVLQSCRYQFEVEEASDGLGALELAGKKRFDIVLLDSSMPGLDSFSTLGRFLQSHADTRIVMVTAMNDSRMADKARTAGAYDVLYKPFYAKDIDAVMNRVHGLMKAKG